MERGPLTLRVLRSSQTDAKQLDDELLSLFKANLHGCLAVFHSARLTSHYRELMLVLQSVIFGLTIASGRPSPGMSLLNLKYRDERRSLPNRNEGPPLTKGQRTLLYLGNIVLPYAWNTLASLLVRYVDGSGPDGRGQGTEDGVNHAESKGIENHAHTGTETDTDTVLRALRGMLQKNSSHSASSSVSEGGHLEKNADLTSPMLSMVLACRLALRSSASGLWNAMQSIEAVWKALELANHVVYIRHGMYRGALDRLVGARLVYGDVSASRHISFDYLNRQLIWSEVSDFVLFVLPLLHAGSVGRFVNKYLPMNESIRGAGTIGADATCPICETTRESPVRCRAVPCGHAYCYYCLASRLATSPEPRCYVCSEHIRRVEML